MRRRHRRSAPTARAIAFRPDRAALTETAIAFALAMLISKVISVM